MSKRNTLNFEQKVQLDKYIKSFAPGIIDARPHPEDLAKKISKALGFKVSESNLRGAMRYAGVSYTARKRYSRPRRKIHPVIIEIAKIARDWLSEKDAPIPDNLQSFIDEQEASNGNERTDDIQPPEKGKASDAS